MCEYQQIILQFLKVILLCMYYRFKTYVQLIQNSRKFFNIISKAPAFQFYQFFSNGKGHHSKYTPPLSDIACDPSSVHNGMFAPLYKIQSTAVQH